MAWLDCERSGIFQIGFSFGGRRFKRSLRTRDQQTAEAALHRMEENIRLILNGRLSIPVDADIPAFLMSDGKISQDRIAVPKLIELGKLFDLYEQSVPRDSLGVDTLRIARIQLNNISRILGKRRQLRTIQSGDLQRFINVRATETGKRGKLISSGTIRKELSTFGTLWRWARQSQFVSREFPNQELRYPKKRPSIPFQTREQIEARIRRGIPKGTLEADYWDCLYLSREELDDLLRIVQNKSDYGFLYPMCLMAAHTGARRSELCRSMCDDVDLTGDSILIREKKRHRGSETFRHVPLSPQLSTVLKEWMKLNENSEYLFPAEYRVSRMRRRNRRENLESVSPSEASDHLEKALNGSKWDVIKGWHIFRHSFISNCATLAVDQRMIDSWVGHQTEVMRKRYRHLFPNHQRYELARVFS